MEMGEVGEWNRRVVGEWESGAVGLWEGDCILLSSTPPLSCLRSGVSCLVSAVWCLVSGVCGLVSRICRLLLSHSPTPPLPSPGWRVAPRRPKHSAGVFDTICHGVGMLRPYAIIPSSHSLLCHVPTSPLLHSLLSCLVSTGSLLTSLLTPYSSLLTPYWSHSSSTPAGLTLSSAIKLTMLAAMRIVPSASACP